MHNILLNKRAGDGNRTHVISLEGWSSTIELHPHAMPRAGIEPATRGFSAIWAVKLLSHFCDFYTLSYSSTLGKLFFQKILFISQIPVFVLKILPFTDSIVSLELCSSARFTKKSASTRI